MTTQEALYKYCLRLGDNSLILSHRLAELCSWGPFLEEDIALTNISLDLIGQAEALLGYAATLEGNGKTADDIAYLRSEREYYNHWLVEQPNIDFGYVIVRQFLNDAWAYHLYSQLASSADEQLAAITAKALKEIRYHLRHSGEWLIRLGDGTKESHDRVQEALNELWKYTGELFEMDEVDATLITKGIVPDTNAIKTNWNTTVREVLDKATLTLPEDGYMVTGSREGIHSEHLGHLLSNMQYLQRAHPGAQW